MHEINYELCDVFTDRPLAGNALAVFTDADDIDAATMQALARETNLSESAFVLRSATGTARRGHPHLHAHDGAAVCRSPDAGDRLRARGPPAARRLSASRPAAASSASASPAGRAARVRLDDPAAAPNRALRARRPRCWRRSAWRRPNLPVELYDNGPHYVSSALDTPEQVAALHAGSGAAGRARGAPLQRLRPERPRLEVSRLRPGEGIAEDPATGAAAGPLAVHLARHGRIAFGDEIVIEQGVEIGRPSTLHARARGSADRLDSVEVVVTPSSSDRERSGCPDAAQRFAAGLGWRARMRSISSIVAFISAIAASNGAEVVMSTPASFSRSMAYFELPDDSIFR